ncbi:MAG: hypothetical protein IR153_06850 [Flavobacterium sp.]|nr:hypothetical protein [Flavobacterium sp.]
MAEENINSLEPTQQPLDAEVQTPYTPEPEPEPKKQSFWTLLIGIFLLIRGAMRYNEPDGVQIWGVAMIIIGLVCIYLFIKDRI